MNTVFISNNFASLYNVEWINFSCQASKTNFTNRGSLLTVVTMTTTTMHDICPQITGVYIDRKEAFSPFD